MSRLQKRSLVILIDLSIIQVSIFTSFCLRYGEIVFPINSQWYIYLFGTLIIFPIFNFFGLYANIFRQSGLKTLSIIFYACFLYGFIFFLLIIFFQSYLIAYEINYVGSIPRSIGIIHPIIFYVLIITSRFFIAYSYQYLNIKNSKQKIIIYGAGENGAQLLKVLENNLYVCAFIDDDKTKNNKIINGIKVYDTSNITRLIKDNEATDVIVAIGNLSSIERNKIYNKFSDQSVRVRFMPNVLNLVNNPSSILSLQEIRIEDLVGRDILLNSSNTDVVKNKNILITGAGGSIGSELSRQILYLNPKNLTLIDHSEFNLFNIFEELKELNKKENKDIKIIPLLINLNDKQRLKDIFNKYTFDFLFHAAAYKHVDLVENNISESIDNNVKNTITVADLSLEFKIGNFVLVSTDKAVRPTTVMGATKKLSELYIQALSNQETHNTKFSIVRFGNVLNSSGSVVPLFKRQILNGGPITLTHPEVSRYFMTIPEAVKLILESSFGASGGEVFVLDMGESVKIIDLARKMIRLSGLIEKNSDMPFGDIEIKIIGLKPEEKLHEELLVEPNMIETENKYIMVEKQRNIDFKLLKSQTDILLDINKKNSSESSRKYLFELINNYK